MVRAALSGALKGVPLVADPVFRVQVPLACPDVPAELLRPRSTWPGPAEYDRTARHLASLFAKNFARYAGHVPPEVAQAGPIAGG
jgi:phosphoenolpyruvate carboxykinase (ATP)